MLALCCFTLSCSSGPDEKLLSSIVDEIYDIRGMLSNGAGYTAAVEHCIAIENDISKLLENYPQHPNTLNALSGKKLFAGLSLEEVESKIIKTKQLGLAERYPIDCAYALLLIEDGVFFERGVADLAVLFSKTGDFERAYELAEGLKGLSPITMAFSGIAVEHHKRGDSEGSISALDHAESALAELRPDKTGEKLPPDY